MNTVVIGGGSSGIIAALKASEYSKVTIVESNNKLGKKILVTGNGKCNFWNKELKLDKYHTDDFDKLDNILSKSNEVFSYLTNELNIKYKEKGNLLYPYSMSAMSIREIFERKVLEKHINVEYEFKVNSIKKIDNTFIISNGEKEIKADKLIVATGGASNPQTGSDGLLFNELNKLGLKIEELKPSLTSMLSDESFLKDWNGLRVDASVSLMVDNEIVYKENGEVQLTDRGVSGIVIFNISSIANQYIGKNNVKLLIDFLPEYDNGIFDLIDYNKDITVEDALETVFQYKLLFVLLRKSGIDVKDKWNEINKKVLNYNIKNFELPIVGLGDFAKSQVTHGGVYLSEVSDNLEIKTIPNLFVIGEALNIDGMCGGYNLASAFITGYIAGENHD